MRFEDGWKLIGKSANSEREGRFWRCWFDQPVPWNCNFFCSGPGSFIPTVNTEIDHIPEAPFYVSSPGLPCLLNPEQSATSDHLFRKCFMVSKVLIEVSQNRRSRLNLQTAEGIRSGETEDTHTFLTSSETGGSFEKKAISVQTTSRPPPNSSIFRIFGWLSSRLPSCVLLLSLSYYVSISACPPSFSRSLSPSSWLRSK